MRLAVFFILLLICCIPDSLCAQERIPRAVGGFHSVAVSSGIDLYLKQSDIFAVEIEGVRPSLFHVRTEIQDSILVISALLPAHWPLKFPPKVYLQCKTLREVGASGGSDVYGVNELVISKLKVHAHSGSDIFLSVKSEHLVLTALNGGSIKVGGESLSVVVTAEGGSEVNAIGLIALDGLVTASGGSEVLINVSRSLSADASGKSHIGYRGTPVEQFFNTFGGSAIYPK
ncbi:putative autotransporter adhesin-like protein [Breznakibacter xylanolyticus]|uniref:Putative autotransporter adhesin-like protein n=1 Tax=Breznakibacter xylanolyticus TaxID=990 RepID=A0A2W7MZW7_9BACT|nr:head GIN domain-containing protein [Breznakibacter xylanolyticus]PZX13705.1 putative autotransporter adhesin-like protein [Breznakibacter xylanolyticus]